MGNNRVSIDSYSGAARVIQEDEYYSFGLRKAYGAYDLSNNNRYLYNGKEIQTDLVNQYDYGARFYDPVIARWTVIDRFAEKFNNFTAYNYVLNNPIKSIDIHGDSAVVLHSPEGAHGAGHMAVLIQGRDKRYHLYSKNGTNEKMGTYGPNDKGNDQDSGSYKSAQEFMNSKANPIINKKTGEREYSEGYIIPSSPLQDKKAISAANKELKKDYNVLGSNCACTVQKALSAAGKNDGSASFVQQVITTAVSPFVKIINDETPNIIYNRMKEQNKGTIVLPKL